MNYLKSEATGPKGFSHDGNATILFNLAKKFLKKKNTTTIGRAKYW